MMLRHSSRVARIGVFRASHQCLRQLGNGDAAGAARQKPSSMQINEQKIDTVERKLASHNFNVFQLSFLGTGARGASKFRNYNSIMLDLGEQNWLFDAGEGTLRQTIRNEKKSVVNTSRIFISHLHMDHVLGLINVVVTSCTKQNTLHPNMKKKTMAKALEPLHIYGPQGLHKFLCSNLSLMDCILQRPVIVYELIVGDDDRDRLWGKVQDGKEVCKWRREPQYYNHPPGDYLFGVIERRELQSNKDGFWQCVNDPLITVHAAMVEHTVPCFAYAVEEATKAGRLNIGLCKDKGIVSHRHFIDLKAGKDVTLNDGRVLRSQELLGAPTRGRKITIVSDTSDASSVFELAKNSDILVHEASFDDSKRKKALELGHSSPRQAATAALKCNSKLLVLNHIGCQYPSLAYKSNSQYAAERLGSSSSKPKLSEGDIHRQAVDTLRGSHCRVIVAKDFLTLKIPEGGFENIQSVNNHIEQAQKAYNLKLSHYKIDLKPQGLPYYDSRHAPHATQKRVGSNKQNQRFDTRNTPSPSSSSAT